MSKMQTTSMNVLVTGATGLIGRQLPAPLSALGFKVIATSRRGGGDLVSMDCLDPSSVWAVMEKLRPSHLIHLAWHDGAKDRWSSSANLDWVGASLALLSAFARSGGRRAVMVGSCAEYDWSQAASGPLREDAALRPSTLYGAAKVATGTAALADSGRAMPATVPPAYVQECGSCHAAYPPGMLPARSWQPTQNDCARWHAPQSGVPRRASIAWLRT